MAQDLRAESFSKNWPCPTPLWKEVRAGFGGLGLSRAHKQ